MKHGSLIHVGVSVWLAAGATAHCSTVLFAENFESTMLSAKPNAYLGGWFTPQVALQEWAGPKEATITTGSLQIAPTNGFRSAAVILGPSVFAGEGDYTLSFDLASYSGDANDAAVVSIWSGSDFGPAGSTGNALILDTLSGTLKTKGTATATQLASVSLDSAASGIDLSFAYDGSSVVALFFGASTGGWPFPVARYDNISLTSALAETNEASASVPEPMGAAGLVSLAAGAVLFRRRRA